MASCYETSVELGLGCMRLSTEPARDDARAAAVLAAALDAGITLLDTADAYAHDDRDAGHNERLVAAAIAGRRVRVVTKGGLVRPDGAWLPDGRAKHLAEAARASRDRLGTVDVYLLHAIDPRTPLATSVRALAKLRETGVVRAIGVSNVGAHQLEQALAITEIDAVEVELSPWRLDALHGGVIARCERGGIELYAHRPLGGPAGVRRLAKDPVVAAIAARLDATPAEVALAWLRALSPVIVPLPGATRIETARSAARRLALDEGALAELRAHWLGDAPATATARRGELVLIVGMPGAGKSTLAQHYVARGYARLNRDERGGTLRDLSRVLDRELASGADRIVLDNTYPTRATRAPVIAAAKRHGIAARCIVMATSLEQAQANAAARVLERHGRLLEPAELARENEIDPRAQFRYRRIYEPPRDDEGFAVIEHATPERAATQGSPALIVDLDDVVWRGRPRAPGEVALVDGAAAHLRAWRTAGYALAATTWQPEPFDPAVDARLGDLLELVLPIARCRHPPGPPRCWCRKPMPGLALALARAHGFDLARSLHVGRGAADRGFATRAGMRYADAWPSP